jgi:zinc ribbon protein
MSVDYTSTTTISDHDLTLAIPGDIGSVRARLVNAIQTLGYKVLGDQPIHAKRGRQCAARWDCSLNVLDYTTTLVVSLKQTNDAAVLATFNYEVKSYMSMTKGDRQTLAREAEAIVALAMERGEVSACRTCGTQVTDESNFCRRCGAPLALVVPELEVLRLTRHARGSYHNIFVGMIVLLLAILTVFPWFISIGGRIVGPMLWVGIPLASYGLFLLLNGARQLHSTLNPGTTKSITAAAQPAFNSSVTTTALPPAPVNSVTEVTTNLLSSKEPVARKNRNTSGLDSDQLM